MELSAFMYISTSNDDKEVGSSFIFTSEKKCLILRKGGPRDGEPDKC